MPSVHADITVVAQALFLRDSTLRLCQFSITDYCSLWRLIDRSLCRSRLAFGGLTYGS